MKFIVVAAIMAPKWDHLPDLVLTHIFKYLSRRDRIAASEVCPSWGHALSSPAIWRNVDIHIDRDLLHTFDPQLPMKEPLAVHLTRMFGQHMQCLNLTWSHPAVSRHHAIERAPHRTQGEAGAAFLSLLRTQGVQLRVLKLTDWIFSYWWSGRGKVVHALTKFISSQRQLEVLISRNSCLGLGEAMRVLAAVVRSSGNVLKELDLRRAVREGQIPHTNSRFLDSLSHLNALTTLRLDYSALSDSVLSVLCECSALLQLQVIVHDTHNHQHSLSDRAWRQLSAVRPNLRVALCVVNMAHYEDICYLILPSIPLNSFQLISGSVWDQSRSRNFRGTIGLLLSYYSNKLEHVQLQLKDNKEMLDDLLLQMLSQCCHLSSLQYNGVLRSLDTVQEICELQVHLRTNFHTLHVRPRYLNSVNQVIVRDICTKYVNSLAEQLVNLTIEDSSSVSLSQC